MLSATRKICFNKQETLLKKWEHLITTSSRKTKIFTEGMLKTLRMKEFNIYLNGGIAHLKRFPRSKAE